MDRQPYPHLRRYISAVCGDCGKSFNHDSECKDDGDQMSILLTPKLDLVFKKLFAEHTGILINLLNAVLGLPKNQRIRSVRVRNPIILPEEITQKFIVLDVLATDRSGRSFEIEMQVRRYESYSKRACII